jgi:hypothetical protein
MAVIFGNACTGNCRQGRQCDCAVEEHDVGLQPTSPLARAKPRTWSLRWLAACWAAFWFVVGVAAWSVLS